jgi:hypothetical protein
MAAARPWAGFGPETFPAEFPRYQSVELARLFPDFYHESPHNTALDALTSEGIPGLLIALAWAVLGGYAGWRGRSAPGAALASALVASCVASMFGAATAGAIFATLLVIAMLVALDDSGAADPPTVNARAAVLAVSAPIAICLSVFGVALAVADFNLARFQRGATDAAGWAALYDSARRTALPGAAEDLYCARRLATGCGVNCARTASQAAARATMSEDNPANAWYNLAMFSAEENDTSQVETALRTSASLAPNWFKPHWALANLLVMTSRGAEARKEAGKAWLLDAGKDPDVSRTFVKLTQSLP